jgi:hypothetical protein
VLVLVLLTLLRLFVWFVCTNADGVTTHFTTPTVLIVYRQPGSVVAEGAIS